MEREASHGTVCLFEKNLPFLASRRAELDKVAKEKKTVLDFRSKWVLLRWKGWRG